MNETLITRAGLARLTRELEHLTTTGRAEIAERIRQAVSSDRNVAESLEYHDVREAQAHLERRIAILEERIAAAQIVDPDDLNGVVDVGERVSLRDLESGEEEEYELVGSAELDPSSARVSAASPLGRALLGRRRGDVAVVDAPRGRLRYEIVGIAPYEPDWSGAR